MDKKAEITLLSILIIVLIIGGISLIKERISNLDIGINYIGDNSTRVYYNLSSENPLCNFKEVNIKQSNLIFFKNINEVEGNWTIDEKCY